MKKKIAVSLILIAVSSTFIFSGCVTDKKTVVTPATTNALGVVTGPVTNTVTTVNTNNLLLDASVLQGATAVAVSVVAQKDPSAVPALRDASVALNGILNGANPQTTGQVLGLLGSNSNATLAAEIGPLIGTVSALEQTLLNKYGSGVSGQITLALTKAVAAGFVAGLAGQPSAK